MGSTILNYQVEIFFENRWPAEVYAGADFRMTEQANIFAARLVE